VGIGAVANDALARAAGLSANGGIEVDRMLSTGDPAISAIGDCAAFIEPDAGVRVRLESVQNAVDQAKFVAARIAGRGGAAAYAAVPWFWSDQASAKLQIAGFALASDRDVVRGNMEDGSFSVFRFDRGRLVAVDSVNAPRDHMAARKLLALGIAISPEIAGDPAIDLKTLLPAGPR
jgi:3-phenylpropionate/trans-cinnamate dioxygenase ferredoxin reductase subunit